MVSGPFPVPDRSEKLRILRAPDAPTREITDEGLYLRRRELLRGAGIAAGAALAPALTLGCGAEAAPARSLSDVRPGPFGTDEEQTPFEDAASYNNFYELGTDKGDPVANAARLVTEPWKVTVDGEVAKPGTFDLDEILKPHALEERIYRLRCVEAWSMVIPWVGFPLGDLLKRFEPTSKAKYVAFETLHDPVRMPGQRRPVLEWPYREGLTIAEATNPLPILAVGLYGESLPNPNGAPIRLVVPWKYGFKGIKSIVRISFVEEQPQTSWNMAQPWEYGFYANVNPEVSHPRWSQARERRIGSGRFVSKQPTLMFNGYAEQVAHLYSGLDLRKNY